MERKNLAEADTGNFKGCNGLEIKHGTIDLFPELITKIYGHTRVPRKKS